MAVTRDLLRSLTLGAPKRAFASRLVFLRDGSQPKRLELELDAAGNPVMETTAEGELRPVQRLRHPPYTEDGKPVQVEVREPNLKERGAIERSIKVSREGELASVDVATLKVELVTRMTYVPGTQQKVFGDADREALFGQPTGGFVDDLFEVAVQLFNAEAAEEAGKNSNGTA